MELEAWLLTREGIAHRAEALRAGFAIAKVRGLVRSGRATMVRRAWIALPEASTDLLAAAAAGGKLSCLSLARRRHWWIPEGADGGVHLHLLPHAGSARLDHGPPPRLHWSVPIAPAARTGLLGTVEDSLAHLAICLPPDRALAVWESAAKAERLAPEALRRVRWTTVRAREMAEHVTGLSDSGIETDIFTALRRHGVAVRQQVRIAGHRVDGLVGARLIVQIDGFEFHAASSAQRTRDIAHDAELQLRGYTVLRFSYHQVVRERPNVERTVLRAIAQGLHLP
ncbi:endonuclease domain-containing protein [Agromyces sp. LHK192]|uniref:endonuclease domain-containing protein n=1 Tax=Agromyces sp. LHK192 TaxID=2498704 RepID=UPI001F0BE7B4|nr:DUF559 domain-containing protein [Agromyces sp. LHK192]